MLVSTLAPNTRSSGYSTRSSARHWRGGKRHRVELLATIARAASLHAAMLGLIACCVGLRAPGPPVLSRRQVLALTAATGVAPLPAALADVALAPQPSAEDFLSLKLQGKRLEPAALDAVKAFYSEDFCAYLARWLICYEPATTRWWVARQAEARAFESAQATRGTPFALSNDAKREVAAASRALQPS